MFHRAATMFHRTQVMRRGHVARKHDVAHPQKAVMRRKALRADTGDAGPFNRGQPHLQRRDDLQGHRVLHAEHIRQITVIAIGPQMGAGGRVYQLRRHPHAVARPPHRAFQHELHPQFAPHAAHIDRATPVGKAGIAGDHRQARHLGQVGDDIFGDPVREIGLLGVA